MMDTIYQKTVKTVVYLGVEDSTLPDITKIAGAMGNWSPSLLSKLSQLISSKHLFESDFPAQGLPVFT